MIHRTDFHHMVGIFSDRLRDSWKLSK